MCWIKTRSIRPRLEFFFINGVFETKPIKYITQTFVKTRTILLLFIFYLILYKVELKQEIDNVNENKMKMFKNYY